MSESFPCGRTCSCISDRSSGSRGKGSPCTFIQHSDVLPSVYPCRPDAHAPPADDLYNFQYWIPDDVWDASDMGTLQARLALRMPWWTLTAGFD